MTGLRQGDGMITSGLWLEYDRGIGGLQEAHGLVDVWRWQDYDRVMAGLRQASRLYTSGAADEEVRVELGFRQTNKKITTRYRNVFVYLIAVAHHGSALFTPVLSYIYPRLR